MRCQFGDHNASSLLKVTIYGKGIWVCESCYELIRSHRNKPYSKVMDKVAMLEAGYYANRKLAVMNNR